MPRGIYKRKNKEKTKDPITDGEITIQIVRTLFRETRNNIKTLLAISATNPTDTSIALAIKDELKTHIDILIKLRKTYLPTTESAGAIPIEDRTAKRVITAWA